MLVEFFLQLINRFEFKPGPSREPLYHILENVYSILQGILEKSIPVESVEAAMLVTSILKVRSTGMYFSFGRAIEFFICGSIYCMLNVYIVACFC